MFTFCSLKYESSKKNKTRAKNRGYSKSEMEKKTRDYAYLFSFLHQLNNINPNLRFSHLFCQIRLNSITYPKFVNAHSREMLSRFYEKFTPVGALAYIYFLMVLPFDANTSFELYDPLKK